MYFNKPSMNVYVDLCLSCISFNNGRWAITPTFCLKILVENNCYKVQINAIERI